MPSLWPTYGTHAQNDTRKNFLGTRPSMLSQFFLFIFTDHHLFIAKNMCVCVCIYIYIYIYIYISDCLQTVFEI
jgi:hypothetical protein